MTNTLIQPYSGRVYAVWGPNGSGKSRFTGSGKKKKWYAEFDRGSFARANFPNKELYEVHYYYPPIEMSLDFGKVVVSQNGGVAPTNSRRMVGMSELIDQFREDFITALKDKEPSDIIYDGSNIMFEYIQQGFQQEIQEATSAESAKQLAQLYFTEPNRRMRAFITTPGQMNKDLFLIEHEKEIWINDKPTGTYKNDGFKEVPNMSDLTLKFFIANKAPVARISKAGAGGLTLLDMEIEVPTVEKVEGILAAAEMLINMKTTVPGTYKELMEKAKKMGG